MKREVVAIGVVVAGASLIGAWLHTRSDIGEVGSPATERSSQFTPPSVATTKGNASPPGAAKDVVVGEDQRGPSHAQLDEAFYRDKIQQRLNALSDAYNRADADAAFLALDENHAVVRPDGRTLYASDVLAQWAIEWTQLKNRSLTFEVEEIVEDGDLLTARWTVDLVAIVTGDDGQEHDFEFNGTQNAIYRKNGEHLALQKPIWYSRVYQLIDGHNVTPHE